MLDMNQQIMLLLLKMFCCCFGLI